MRNFLDKNKTTNLSTKNIFSVDKFVVFITFLLFFLVNFFVDFPKIVAQNPEISTKTASKTTTKRVFSTAFKFSSSKRKKWKTSFKLRSNLIILPFLLDNSKDTLNMVLDTGVGYTIITDTSYVRKLNVSGKASIYVRGVMHKDTVKAYVSEKHHLYNSKITADNLRIIVMASSLSDFSELAGMHIHGIIGYDIFNSFAIKINYQAQEVTFYRKDIFEPSKKYQTSLLSILGRKPYISSVIRQETNVNGNINNQKNNNQKNSSKNYNQNDTIQLNLLIDTGSGQSLMLRKETSDLIVLPKKTFYTQLGTTISGKIYGNMGRIEILKIGKYELKKLITSYPDNPNDSIFYDNNKFSNGSVGIDVLKQFVSVIDYQNKKIYLKKTSEYNRKKDYIISGLTIGRIAPYFEDVVVLEVQENSPAYRAGIKVDDEITVINNQIVFKQTTNEIYGLLEGDDIFTVNLVIKRKNEGLLVISYKPIKIL